MPFLDAGATSHTPARPPKGYLQITSLSAAAGLGTVPAGGQTALIQCQDQQVRWRDDGVDPTTTVGSLLSPGETLIYDGDLATIRLIEVLASAKLNVSFYA